MQIPYEALTQLPNETLENMIKEYLFSQVEDGGFDALNGDRLTQAIAQCKQALQRKELLVEYSEDDQSIAIRRADQVVRNLDIN
ncbi:YheU family protein [Shewanella marina]|uniref:YheU family protein n=1 Tax=Shewanella marina TaxID=487319 RepID=UPI000472641A|nr:YheU family protein [Shewanella marina]